STANSAMRRPVSSRFGSGLGGLLVGMEISNSPTVGCRGIYRNSPGRTPAPSAPYEARMLAILLLAAVLVRWASLGPPASITFDVASSAGSDRRLFVIGSLPGDGSGVYRTDDGGSTWESVFQPTSADYPTILATDPFDGNRLFVGSVHAGFSG